METQFTTIQLSTDIDGVSQAVRLATSLSLYLVFANILVA